MKQYIKDYWYSTRFVVIWDLLLFIILIVYIIIDSTSSFFNGLHAFTYAFGVFPIRRFLYVLEKKIKGKHK